MKDKRLLIIIFSIVIILVAILLSFKYLFKIEKNNGNKLEAIYLSEEVVEDFGEYQVFKNYDDFNKVFKNTSILKTDFDKSNILVFEVIYDTCSESDLKPKEVTYKNEKLNVIFEYKAKCGLCAPLYMYYFVKIDKNSNIKEFNIDYEATNKPDCPTDVAYKPMIYLYPTTDTLVNIKLLNSEYLTTTYPKYNNGWSVVAKTNGDLIDDAGRTYYGLYWEGINHKASIKEDGFVVKGEDTIKFLEEKLALLGLNEREANEFIVYWLPKLEVNKYNYIRFETLEEINDYMPVSIEPNPDTIIRVLMDYKPLDKEIEVQEQKINTPIRNGFTVVEWGGSLIITN